ncbi:MAG TPA: type II/IV secretion system protein [Candidatus Yonathbacteria bacterium]|nr:type II/IV secretion system protein [Candidatus Yonathbacteria bacterium]
MTTFNEVKQKKRLKEFREKEEEALVKMLSVKYGIHYLDISTIRINNSAIGVVKETDARDASLGVFDINGKKLSIAILSPNNDKTNRLLEDTEKRGYKITLFMASHRGIEKIWERYKDITNTQKSEAGVLDISTDELESILKKFNSIDEVRSAVNESLQTKDIHRISRIFEIVLGGAIATGVSDVHFDPQEDAVRLRYRLDGILVDVTKVDHKTYHFLISRIKLLSGLKLNVTNDTQDGRFSIKINEMEIEIRTSILPGPYAEGAVMRILNPESIEVTLDELGIEPGLLEIFKKEMGKPNGMILNTGPTGSGKTTTLYAFLKKIYNPEIKIITIEDPIEYHLKGVTQTQVDSKTNYTFLNGLRAALRQDPDAIMIGEIRDGETAKIAINSALTGHLVLSTLHTNTAAGAIPRLIDLGVNPKVIGSALNIAIAQRLVRKLCEHCKKEATPNEGELTILKKVLESIKAKRGKEVFDFDPIKIWRAGECDKCNAGYKGRIGVYEAILMDEALEMIMAENPNEREIKKAAQPQGIFDMKEDGVLKILRGVTSMEELGRVIELND